MLYSYDRRHYDDESKISSIQAVNPQSKNKTSTVKLPWDMASFLHRNSRIAKAPQSPRSLP